MPTEHIKVSKLYETLQLKIKYFNWQELIANIIVYCKQSKNIKRVIRENFTNMHGVKYIHGLPFSSNKRRKLKKVVGHFFFFLRNCCKKFKFASDEEK